MHYYYAYNCLIASELPFPELIAAPNDEPDVYIRVGETPATLTTVTGQGVLYQASQDEFLLHIDHVARYLVRNGNEIVVQPLPGSLVSDVRVFLLGSCIGALLHQRGLLVLHAAAIHTEVGAVLFTGPSGSGKSTLLGELLNRGYAMMVDDVCAVQLDEQGAPMVLPGYPRLRLWADAARKLALETTALPRTRPTLEKFEHQVPAQFWGQPAPLHHIYQLTATNKDELRLERLPRLHNFKSVLHNTYRRSFLAGLVMRQHHFGLVATIASRVDMTRIVRPAQPFRLRELADLILASDSFENQEFAKGHSHHANFQTEQRLEVWTQ